MRERKFNFVPLRANKKIREDKFFPFVKIAKNGNLYIGGKTLEALGITHDCSVRLYEDIAKRALGFKVVKEVGKKEDGYRFVTLKKYAGAIRAQISIRSFLNKLLKVALPSKRLPIDKYSDTDTYMQIGEVFYIKIPYGDIEEK